MTFQVLQNKLVRAWYDLTNPVPRITDPLTRRTGRWMMTLCLLVGLFTMGYNVIMANLLKASIPFFQRPLPSITALMLLGIIVMYVASRYGYAAFAGLFASYFFSVMVALNALPTDNGANYHVLSYLVLIVVYSQFFLGIKASLGILLFQTLLVLGLPLVDDSITYGNIIGILMFLAVMSVLIGFIANYYKMLEVERQQDIQESEEQYRSLFSSSVYVNMIHNGRQVLLCNEAVARLLGWESAESLIGASFKQFIHPEDYATVTQRARQRLDGSGSPPERYMHRVIRKDGGVRWVDSQSTVIRFRGQLATLVNAIDVTDQQVFSQLIERSRNFEGIITTISTVFINLESDLLDVGIDTALELIGGFALADHAYVILFDDENYHSFTNTHEWRAEGIPSHQAIYQHIPAQDYAWGIQTMLAGQAINVANVALLQDIPDKSHLQATGVQAFVEVPMVYRGLVLGILGCDSVTKPTLWSDDVVAMLQIVAEIFASAIQRQRAEQTLKQRNQVLEVLSQLGAVAVSTLELHTLLREAGRLIMEALEMTSVYLCDYNPATDQVTVLADYYAPTANDLERVSDLGMTYVDNRYNDYQAPQIRSEPFLYVLIYADDPTLSEYDRHHFAQYGGQTVLNTPLFVKGSRIGSIELWDSQRKRQFTSDELQLMDSFFAQIALLFDRSQAYEAFNRSEQQNNRLLNALPDLAFRQNQLGFFLEAPLSAHPDLPINPSAWLGKYPQQVLPLLAADAFTDAIEEALASDRVQMFEFEVPHQGEPYTYEARVIKIAAGEVLTFIRNITERKQASQRQLELSIERERVLILQDFISYASHDLRTPIANVKSRLYLLSKIDDREKRQHHIQVMDTELSRLTQLIDDLLTMSHLDSGIVNSTLRAIFINSMLRDLAEANQPSAKQKGIQLVFELAKADISILGNATELSRMFTNLLSNAITYTPLAGQITLRTYVDEGGVVIEIQDTGIGIAEEDIPHIFERFYRADKARSSHSGGTGLGLAIVKKIVDLHDGRIEVQSVVEKGTTFRVWLPDVRMNARKESGLPT
jgi:PAS domain S-box-containing protein